MITFLNVTKNPVSTIGRVAGICYNSDITNDGKNYKRGLECFETGHGRTLESVDICMVIDGYSAKFYRELYTHIGGSPMRLQESTRYIDYANKGLEAIMPPSISENEEAKHIFNETVSVIQNSAKRLEEIGIKKEDASMLFPLCMKSKMVLKCNLRMLIEMSHQRLCSRAFWEFRKFMHELMAELYSIDDEWAWVVQTQFKPKCEYLDRCPEKNSCGRKERYKHV